MDRVEVLIIMAVCLSILNTANYVEGQNTVLAWRVVNEGNTNSVYMYFRPDNVQEFIDCVCGRNTLWCGLYYTDSRGTYLTGRENITQSVTENMYSNVYSCRSTSSNAPYVKCERLTTTACSGVHICWSYQFSDFQGSCELGEVGFTWVSDQTFTQNVHNKVTVTSPCNRSCPAQTTTGPTTTTSTSTTRSSTMTTLGPTTTNRSTFTTTTTSTTVKPAAVTSSTSTPTTHEDSAPQNEDDSDDTGIIVGVVIAALMVGGSFCWRRRKNSTKADRARGTTKGVHTSAFGIGDRDNSAENIINLTPYENVLVTGRPSSDIVGRDNKNNDDNINSSTPSYENVLDNGRQSSGNVDSDNNNVLNQGPVQPSSGNENNDNNNGDNTNSFTPYENVLGDGRQENVDSHNKNNCENTNSFTPYENALD